MYLLNKCLFPPVSGRDWASIHKLVLSQKAHGPHTLYAGFKIGEPNRRLVMCPHRLWTQKTSMQLLERWTLSNLLWVLVNGCHIAKGCVRLGDYPWSGVVLWRQCTRRSGFRTEWVYLNCDSPDSQASTHSQRLLPHSCAPSKQIWYHTSCCYTYQPPLQGSGYNTCPLLPPDHNPLAIERPTSSSIYIQRTSSHHQDLKTQSGELPNYQPVVVGYIRGIVRSGGVMMGRSVTCVIAEPCKEEAR